MLNTILLNTGNLNGYYLSSSGSLSTELVTFESYIFGGDITVTDIKEDSAPDRDVAVTNAVRSHGQYIVSDYFTSKKITVKGWCKKQTQEDLDNWIDEFKKSLIKQGGNLDITRRGVARRRYKATLVNFGTMFEDKEPYHVTVTPFTCEFLCVDPFGYDTEYLYSSETLTANANISVTSTGTFDTKPVIYMSVDAGSIDSITITNITTGASITVPETISTGILKIDSEILEVTVNDVQKNFTGAFLNFIAGTNILQFTITGTGYNLNTTIKWKNSFI